MGSEIERRLAGIRSRVNARLAELIPQETDEPRRLHRAMRYSLLAPGKRIRPVMTVMTCTQLGGVEELAIDPACAIEMVHAASLIIDDLPAMDDASLRRGQPTNHMVHGEEVALLAGIALLNRAYGVLGSSPGLSSELRLALVNLLASAVGSSGLIAGQTLDLEGWPGQDASGLEKTNILKTAALFVAGAETGARISGLAERRIDSVRRFARHLGLAFQIHDDLLDASSSEKLAGKDVEQDDSKSTFVSLIGFENARALASRMLDDAINAIAPLVPPNDPLAEFARSLFTKTSSSATTDRAGST